MNVPQVFKQTLNVNLGKISFSPSYIQAGAIVVLLFLLVLTLARVRRLYVNWNFSSAGSMIFIGFVLALILEGFLILGGRTMLTEILGWENAPKPLKNVLVAGRERMAEVLGVTEKIPDSYADDVPDLYDVVTEFQSLNPEDTEKFRSMICVPEE